MSKRDMDEELEPPAETSKLQQPIKFCFQVLYICIIFVPILISSTIWNLFLLKPKSVRGKVVMITGSGRGLGRGFAQKFANLGCRVACVDLDEKLNMETVSLINKLHPNSAIAYKCNIAFSSELLDLHESVKRDFGEVNLIIHNAALIATAPIIDFKETFLDTFISVNLKSHFLMIREFLPAMLKRNEGHFVSVASVAGFAASSDAAMYTACKHGIVGLMESVYHYLREIPGNNVRVSCVCPYFINTSATYSRYYSTRIPGSSIEDTVDKAIDGILKNKRLITVPNIFYYLIHFMKLVPDKFQNTVRKILYVDIIPPTMETQMKFRLMKMTEDSFNVSFNS